MFSSRLNLELKSFVIVSDDIDGAVSQVITYKFKNAKTLSQGIVYDDG